MSQRYWRVQIPGSRRPWRVERPTTAIGRFLMGLWVLAVWTTALALQICIVLPLKLTFWFVYVMFRIIF